MKPFKIALTLLFLCLGGTVQAQFWKKWFDSRPTSHHYKRQMMKADSEMQGTSETGKKNATGKEKPRKKRPKNFTPQPLDRSPHVQKATQKTMSDLTGQSEIGKKNLTGQKKPRNKRPKNFTPEPMDRSPHVQKATQKTMSDEMGSHINGNTVTRQERLYIYERRSDLMGQYSQDNTMHPSTKKEIMNQASDRDGQYVPQTTEHPADKNERYRKESDKHGQYEPEIVLHPSEVKKIRKADSDKQGGHTIAYKVRKKTKDMHPSARHFGQIRSRSLKAAERFRKRKLFINRLDLEVHYPPYMRNPRKQKRQNKPNYDEDFQRGMWAGDPDYANKETDRGVLPTPGGGTTEFGGFDQDNGQ